MIAAWCRRLLLSALLAGIAGAVVAATPPAGRAPPVPLLWKVSDGAAHLYLLGSFHLLRADDYPLSQDVDKAFADAERVVFELAPDEVESPALGARMLQVAQRRDGHVLSDELDAPTWAKLQAWAAHRNMPVASLQGYKAWFVGLSVGLAEMAGQGMDPALGLDRHFMVLAGKAGKPTAGLERAEDQVTMLDGMAPEEQRQLLAEALDDAEAGSAQSQRLHDAWRRGDARQLWDEMGRQMRHDYPALYKRINVERNARWTPALVGMLEAAPAQGDTLVVVGALHLLGEDGVVARLRAKGYRVERICSVCAEPASAR